MKRRSISKRGALIELDGGGSFRALPQNDNIQYHEKLRKLQKELREERGLPADANLSEALTYSELAEMMARAMIGPVIRWWDGFDDEDGNPIPCEPDSAGHLNEEVGVQILLFPGVSEDFANKMKEVNGKHDADSEVLAGNSSEPSSGISTTAGS